MLIVDAVFFQTFLCWTVNRISSLMTSCASRVDQPLKSVHYLSLIINKPVKISFTCSLTPFLVVKSCIIASAIGERQILPLNKIWFNWTYFLTNFYFNIYLNTQKVHYVVLTFCKLNIIWNIAICKISNNPILSVFLHVLNEVWKLAFIIYIFIP